MSNPKGLVVEMAGAADKLAGGDETDYDRIAIQFMTRSSEWNAEKTKQLLWKVDLRLLPWLVLMYTTNFLDRTYGYTQHPAFTTPSRDIQSTPLTSLIEPLLKPD